MKDKRVLLKVKIKSLAVEAKIIRSEENLPHNKSLRSELAAHRKGIVRHEARHTLLAYAFLKGLKRSDLEKSCHFSPDWKKVEHMVESYGVYLTEEISLVEWRAERAKQHERFKEWILEE